MLNGILIDLENTLLDDHLATTQAVLALCVSCPPLYIGSAEEIASRWLAITQKYWRRYREGRITFQEQRRERLREFSGKRFSDSESNRIFQEYLVHYEKAWCLASGAEYFLSQTTEIPKALVTNGEAKQVAKKVSALQLTGHFTAIVTPEAVGAAKPNPKIFFHALGLLSAKADDCLMVGDNLEEDINPALAIGIRAFHVDSTQGRGLREAVAVIQKPSPVEYKNNHRLAWMS